MFHQQSLKSMDEQQLVEAHKYCRDNREQLLASEKCGCFYCFHIFPPSAIKRWVYKSKVGTAQTALCPECGIDAVLGSEAGFPLTPEFLKAMPQRWFERFVRPRR